MATSGQTLNDRINAARYALAGQGLARCVCKATTEEVIGPKKKHLDYLLHCTHEPNALVTVHHLMSYGNERFIQYLASSNYSFELSTFLDKTAARDFSMSTFIRRYSRYINEKALSYRILAFDFCKIKRGNEGVLRLMPIDRLLKTLPVLQNQLDTLLEFDCSANDLNNGVINACFMLLFRDLIGLFACHSDGIINLLNKYFTLNRKMCREAYDLYKKFLVRVDKVSDFLRVAEVVGIDRDEIPDLRRAPSSLIDALEAHLQNIESNKKILKNQQPSTSSTGNGGKTSSSSESPAFGSLASPTSTRRPSSPNSVTSTKSQNDEFSLNSFKDEEVRKALEEEARVLSQYGTEGHTKASKSSSNKNNSASGTLSLDSDSPKFAVTTIPKSIDDIFGDSDSFATSNNNNNNSSNNNNGLSQFDNNNAFDNLNNSTSGSSQNTGSKHSRPDLDSIRSAIKSATTTLEKQQSTTGGSAKVDSGKSANPKKASDDLFSLLDTTAVSAETNPKIPASSSQHGLDLVVNTTQVAPSMLVQQLNSTSPFSAVPPFNVQPNGQQLQPLKPGNPFPDVNSAFGGPSMPFSPLNPSKAQSQSSVGRSVFSSGTTTANYTNLGGLEGFGDLLQPMSASNKGSSHTAYNANNKPSFSTNSGLPSTGLFKGDLDSTLANLAQNLTFDGITKTKK